jgi:hypothetical protein
MSIRLPSVSLVCILTCLFLGACSSIPRIPAKGEFFGQRVDTTVDSEIARYYLESYLQGKNEIRDMDEQISALYSSHGKSVPSREELKAISQAFSVDFAALFLADRLLNNRCNKDLNQRFERYLKDDTAVDASIASSYQILFVPGWDYVKNGHKTGADFAKPRELATKSGFENYLVMLPPTGSVEEGANVLAAEITRHNRSGKNILLVGTSSAGPVIHLALGELLDEKELRSIKTWLNLGGILRGTPFIDYFERRPQRWLFNFYIWLKGFDKEAILSMGTAPSRRRFSSLHLDSDIVVINYMGIPLSGQLSQYSGTGYRMLRSDGPNDGLALLTDEIAPGSLTVIALGSDHFIAEDQEIDKKTIALMKLIVNYSNKAITIGCTGQNKDVGWAMH